MNSIAERNRQLDEMLAKFEAILQENEKAVAKITAKKEKVDE